MSVFPTARPGAGWRVGLDGGTPLEAEGVLVRPISGQIYLIEEEDLETLTKDGRRQPRPSGLVSRH